MSEKLEGVWCIFHDEMKDGEIKDRRVNSAYEDPQAAEHALKMLVEHNLPSYMTPKEIYWRDSRNVHISEESGWHDRYYIDFIPMNVKYEK